MISWISIDFQSQQHAPLEIHQKFMKSSMSTSNFRRTVLRAPEELCEHAGHGKRSRGDLSHFLSFTEKLFRNIIYCCHLTSQTTNPDEFWNHQDSSGFRASCGRFGSAWWRNNGIYPIPRQILKTISMKLLQFNFQLHTHKTETVLSVQPKQTCYENAYCRSFDSEVENLRGILLLRELLWYWKCTPDEWATQIQL